jgi:hypothetical protein
MLPHSTPFVPTVNKYDTDLLLSITDAYLYSSQVVSNFNKNMGQSRTPFSMKGRRDITEVEHKICEGLRSQMYQAIFGGLKGKIEQIPFTTDEMFESCSVQETGVLHFHRDVLNCPVIDETVAVHVSSQHDFGKKCVSFLFYTRKCVGDFARRKASIETYLLRNQKNCELTTLCLKSILEVKGIFNYQGSLFENTKSLTKIADSLINAPEYQCLEVT